MKIFLMNSESSLTLHRPLMSHGLFQCPRRYVSGPGSIVVALLSTEGQRALRFDQKYLNFCSEDVRRPYASGITLVF